MSKKFAAVACVLLFLTNISAAQVLPKSAVVLEKRNVTANRQMILWMENPQKHPREASDDIYTCPEQTRGHYYSGVTKVSLVDLKTQKIVQTLEVVSDEIDSGSNSLDLPYLIQRTGFYDVPKIDKNKEGRPVLMNLKDYNGDGKAFEFALFDAVACMGLPSTLIGYSQRQDKVIQYQTELKSAEGTRKEFWVDYFFGHKADKLGVWKYQIDYRGRAGTLDKYELRYDKQREIFYGSLISISDEEVTSRPNK
jgi:hypothetical protein